MRPKITGSFWLWCGRPGYAHAIMLKHVVSAGASKETANVLASVSHLLSSREKLILAI